MAFRVAASIDINYLRYRRYINAVNYYLIYFYVTSLSPFSLSLCFSFFRFLSLSFSLFDTFIHRYREIKNSRKSVRDAYDLFSRVQQTALLIANNVTLRQQRCRNAAAIYIAKLPPLVKIYPSNRKYPEGGADQRKLPLGKSRPFELIWSCLRFTFYFRVIRAHIRRTSMWCISGILCDIVLLEF